MVPLLVWTMSAGTMAYAVLAVTAAPMLDDLGIGATDLGLVLLTYSASAAVLSPIAGRLSDRIGATRTAQLTLLLTGLAYPLMGSMSSTATLALATLPLGMAQATINPSTNGMIAAHAPDGKRGLITGIKQSGVYVGYVFVGVAAPLAVQWWSWRAAFYVVGAVCLLGGLLSLFGLPPTESELDEHGARTPIADSAKPHVRRLAVYAGLMGLASSTNSFIPLFAETELGYSNAAAGLYTAMVGVIAVAVRILTGAAAEHRIRPGRLLQVMGGFGVVTSALLLASALVPSLLWAAGVAYALGPAPWNAVAMFAIIVLVGRAASGTATGWVVGSFSAGLAAGPLIFGPIIDGFGFPPVWAVAAIAAAVAAIVIGRFRSEPAPA